MPARVRDTENIRLAMLGMTPGNGQPYLYASIVNGRYLGDRIVKAGHRSIRDCLDRAAPELFGLDGVEITHLWCDNPADAALLAEAAFIPQLVEHPEQVIGEVDAVIIPTDRAGEHVDRARPFIEAGLPVFLDEPLADRPEDLEQFVSWRAAGAEIFSAGALRFAPEYLDLRERLVEVGLPRLVTLSMLGSWRRCGLLAMEAAYGFAHPGGWLSVSLSGGDGSEVCHVRHESGLEVVIPALSDLVGSWGWMHVYGTAGMISTRHADAFAARRGLMLAFAEYLRGGRCPVAFAETVELTRILLAGLISRRDSGRSVGLEELKV
jgi:hypothetical protein